MCGQTLSLPPLPAEVAVDGPESDAEAIVASFAEQFSIDVSAIGDERRSRLSAALGNNVFRAVVLMYIADFIPRVRAGMEALGVGQEYLEWVDGLVSWDHSTDPSDAVFNGLLPAVARLRALDALTSEVVRLRGAAQHNCRLCKSLREARALDAGGAETLYDDIERFQSSGPPRTGLSRRNDTGRRFEHGIEVTKGDFCALATSSRSSTRRRGHVRSLLGSTPTACPRRSLRRRFDYPWRETSPQQTNQAQPKLRIPLSAC